MLALELCSCHSGNTQRAKAFGALVDVTVTAGADDIRSDGDEHPASKATATAPTNNLMGPLLWKQTSSILVLMVKALSLRMLENRSKSLSNIFVQEDVQPDQISVNLMHCSSIVSIRISTI